MLQEQPAPMIMWVSASQWRHAGCGGALRDQWSSALPVSSEALELTDNQMRGCETKWPVRAETLNHTTQTSSSSCYVGRQVPWTTEAVAVLIVFYNLHYTFHAWGMWYVFGECDMCSTVYFCFHQGGSLRAPYFKGGHQWPLYAWLYIEILFYNLRIMLFVHG